MTSQNNSNNNSSNASTYEIRKGPGTRNISNSSVSQISSKEVPKPKK